MTEDEIISQVRFRLDEEDAFSDYVSGYMDNIIKACISDALRWVCLYANASLLLPSSSTEESPCIKSYELSYDEDAKVYDDGTKIVGNVITLPYSFLRVLRVRATSWSKGVSRTISEDSEEYLMQYDATSGSTEINPRVAEIISIPQTLELFPAPSEDDTVYLVIAVEPSSSKSASETTWNIPKKVEGAFLYYLAYLVMVAYNDTTKAQGMLSAAKMELATTAQASS